MKLAVVGGRDFYDKITLWHEITDFWIQNPLECIISGGAKGADSFAAIFAQARDIPLVEFLPDWEEYGKSAGFRRNKQIVDACDKLIAFWDGKSKGTKHSIDLAEAAGKLYKVVYYAT